MSSFNLPSWDSFEDALTVQPSITEPTVIPVSPKDTAPAIGIPSTTTVSITDVKELDTTDIDSKLLAGAKARLDKLDLSIAENKLFTESQRIEADDKRMINGTSDVNQLIPFKYEWAWTKYLNGCANHWMPTEVNMAADIKQWTAKDVLTDAERLIVKRTLGFFASADTMVMNNLALGAMRHITAPEALQFMARQIFEEALRAHSYQHIIQSLSLDEGELFNMYREVPAQIRKAAWALEYTKTLADPDFKPDSIANIQTLVKCFAAYWLVVEGMFFYCGFTQILSMGRRNKMTSTAEQLTYILRDESNHLNFGVDLINEIINENPEIWTQELIDDLTQIIVEGTLLECDFARDTMPDGITGMNCKLMDQYLKFIANRRLEQLGLPKVFGNAKNTMPWLSEMMDLAQEKNFFEGRPVEYQVGVGLKID